MIELEAGIMIETAMVGRDGVSTPRQRLMAKSLFRKVSCRLLVQRSIINSDSCENLPTNLSPYRHS